MIESPFMNVRLSKVRPRINFPKSLDRWLSIKAKYLQGIVSPTKQEIKSAEDKADLEFMLPEPTQPDPEWLYRYTERIGLLAGDEEPTESEMAMARRDADEAMERLR